MVKLLPMWLAPNLVTLLGFCCILGNIVLLQMYIPDLVGPVSIAAVRAKIVSDHIGTIMAVLQFWSWRLDVFDDGQH